MARKRVSVEEVLSKLCDIPEDTSECGDEISLDIESDDDEFVPVSSDDEFVPVSSDDEFVPVSSSSESEDERDSNIQEPPGTVL